MTDRRKTKTKFYAGRQTIIIIYFYTGLCVLVEHSEACIGGYRVRGIGYGYMEADLRLAFMTCPVEIGEQTIYRRLSAGGRDYERTSTRTKTILFGFPRRRQICHSAGVLASQSPASPPDGQRRPGILQVDVFDPAGCCGSRGKQTSCAGEHVSALSGASRTVG